MQKHILKVLENYKKQFPSDEVVDKFLEFAKENPNCTDRNFFPAHFTVSAIVISDQKILVLHHKALNISIQPGGHIEAVDKNLFSAVIREVKEETGLDVEVREDIFQYIPFLLDIHNIPENHKKEEVAHQHFDIFFLLDLKNKNQKIKNNDDGTENAKWVNLETVMGNSSLGKVVEKFKKTNLI